MRAKRRPSASSASNSSVTSVGLRIASGAGAVRRRDRERPGAEPACGRRSGTTMIALGLPLLEDLELVGPQVGDGVALLVPRHHVEHDGLGRPSRRRVCRRPVTGVGRRRRERRCREQQRRRPAARERSCAHGPPPLRLATSSGAPRPATSRSSSVGVSGRRGGDELLEARATASALSFWFRATVARWYCVSKFCGSSCSALRNASLASRRSPELSASTPSAYCSRPLCGFSAVPFLTTSIASGALAGLGEQGGEPDVAVDEGRVEVDRLAASPSAAFADVALLLVERPEVVVHERDLRGPREDRLVGGDRPVGVAVLRERDRGVDVARELAHVDRCRGRGVRRGARPGRRAAAAAAAVLRHELVLGWLLQGIDLLQVGVERDLAEALLAAA